MSDVVLASRNMCVSSNVIATPRPAAVLFMASEIAEASSAAFSAGFACDTVANAWINAMMVPSRPTSMPMLASELR